MLEKDLEKRLASLDESRLRDIVKYLLHKYPDEMGVLEHTLTQQEAQSELPPSVATSAPPYKPVSVDTRLYEKLLHNALNNLSFDYDYYADFAEIKGVFEELAPSLHEGVYCETLFMLERLTDLYLEEGEAQREIHGYYGDGAGNIVFSDRGVLETLDLLWAEAVLGCEPDPEEASRLLAQLEYSRDTMAGEWHSGELSIAMQTLRDLGAASEEEAHPLEGTSLANYNDIRLRVLEHKERFNEALALAEAESRWDVFLRIKLSLGALEEVMRLYPDTLESVLYSLRVAEALHANGDTQEALTIAKHGLSLPDTTPNYPYSYTYSHRVSRHEHGTSTARRDLAALAQTLARETNDSSYLLEATIIEFKAEPSVKRYEVLESLAGDAWERVKEDLLAFLRKHNNADVKVAIFLKEERHEDAIAALNSYLSYDSLVHQVMNAAFETHPQWVIEEGKKRAEEIMKAARSKYYDDATAWLEKVKRAYEAAEQTPEWQAYFRTIHKKHARKYKLMQSFKDKGLA